MTINLVPPAFILIFGALLVLGFMIIYYRLSGIIANFALTLNILFLFSGLAVLNAVLDAGIKYLSS